MKIEYKKIFLVESGLLKGDSKDLTRAFFDEKKAWEYVLRRYKGSNLQRKNWYKKRGFRGIVFGRNRWISITEIVCV